MLGICRIGRELEGDRPARSTRRIAHRLLLCKRMARLCEGDPDCFPCRSSEAPSWMKVTRRGISDAMAIVEAPGDGIAVK